ncbi:MAG TPA: DUF2911 domain-containing protein [Longimicrobiales bacterium]|nr:DUF2911 domain-containing protein [Longimicrobiales bacterium]
MRIRTLLLAPALLATLVPVPSSAQVTASERSTVTQTITGVAVEIDYSRPSARGRDPLFGGVVPWGEVWTPGANDNTTIRFGDTVTVNGVDVPPGKYGVWIQVLENEPWQFVLHTDTTRFHTEHPTVESAFLSFPVEREHGAEFVETLTLDLQRIRADGAVLQLAWGLNRVRVPIGVDPGYVMTVPAEEAERYVGAWVMDQSGNLPPDEVVQQWVSTMTPEMAGAVREMVAIGRVPYAIEIQHDEEGRLVIRDPLLAKWWMTDLTSVQGILLPRAEGVFDTGTLLMGDLVSAEVDGPSGGFWEFEFDETGRAVRLLGRSQQDDRVILQATRVDEGGSAP